METSTYTWAEVEAICAELAPYWQVMVRVQLDAGCRWNELQGLQARDLGADGWLRIHRVIDEGLEADSGTGSAFTVKDYPKNKERRSVELSPAVVALLRDHIAARGLAGEDFLLSQRAHSHTDKPLRDAAWPNGRPVYRSNRNATWRRAMQRAGVPREVSTDDGRVAVRTPYKLRATMATELDRAGVPHHEIRARLGHRDLRTLQRYVAHTRAPQTQSKNAMSHFYGG